MELLEQIQLYLGVGNVTKQGSELVQYRVASIKDLEKVINHFDKYPLVTEKLGDYELFKDVYSLVKKNSDTVFGIL